MITFRQCRTGVASPPTGREIEARYRCIDARHEPVTYNPVHDKTWCLCGRVIRDGDHSRWPTRYEYAETDAARTDLVGREARAYLREVHGTPEWGGRDPDVTPYVTRDTSVTHAGGTPEWGGRDPDVTPYVTRDTSVTHAGGTPE